MQLLVGFFKFLISFLIVIFSSCGVRKTPEVNSTPAQIFKVGEVEIDKDFELEIKRLGASHFSLTSDVNSVKVYLPGKNVSLVLIREDNGIIKASLPSRLSRQEKLYFSVNQPTPTPTPLVVIIEKKVYAKPKKATVVKSTPSLAPSPSPTPPLVRWTKDRIALEILKGNAPRDSAGNLVHKVEKEKVTLQDLVSWYCGSLEHLYEISEFNGGLPVDAQIVEGVEVKIPEKFIKNPKKFHTDKKN